MTAADLARRATAMALAPRPDDPWLRAHSAHAVPAANAASATLARCGGDEVAQYGEQPEPTERDGMKVSGPPPLIKPAGPGYVAATQRIDASLRGSGDPYARAVADWLNIGDVMSPDDRIATLVNDAASTRDPRVYGLAYHACLPLGIGATPASACTLLSARQWATLDPGNGVPWLAVLADAQAHGDTEGQREALFRMASSTRWHQGYADAPAIVGMQLPDDDTSATANRDLTARAMVASLSFTLSSLVAGCKDKAGGDADRAQQCVTIAHLMLDQGDTIIDHLLVGGAVVSAGDRRSVAARRGARADYRADHLGCRRLGRGRGRGDDGVGRVASCADLRTLGRLFKRGSEIGELAALREQYHVFPPP